MRKGLLLPVMIIIMFGASVSACGAGNRDQEPASSTGYASDEVQRMSVYWKGSLYLYTGGGFDQPLGRGYTKAGTVQSVSNLAYPEKDLHGTRLEIGQEVYVNQEDASAVYVKFDRDYALFERETEDISPANNVSVHEADSPVGPAAVLPDWVIPESFVGTWRLDIDKTSNQLKNHESLAELFDSKLGAWSSSMEIGTDGSLHCMIGNRAGGSGKCRPDGSGIRVSIAPFEDTGDQEELLQLKITPEPGAGSLIMEYNQENLYWILDTDGEPYFKLDGISYEKVRDLEDGMYHWASSLTEATTTHDEHGHENSDYNSQQRSFVCLDDGREIQVRRWDNLGFSAGKYLIFEYNGTMHVSKSEDLYHPVLSLKGSFGMLSKVPGGYMAVNAREYTVTFYDKDFRIRKVAEGLRAMENGTTYEDGLMAVRDMDTGLMGYMDQEGNIGIPCEYGTVSDFSNGYASVLTGASLIPYTEDSGTIAMFDAEGGQWGIINTRGEFVVEPSRRFANQEARDPNINWYCGARRFSPVREDGTADFVALDQDNKVMETIQIPQNP